MNTCVHGESEVKAGGFPVLQQYLLSRYATLSMARPNLKPLARGPEARTLRHLARCASQKSGAAAVRPNLRVAGHPARARSEIHHEPGCGALKALAEGKLCADTGASASKEEN